MTRKSWIQFGIVGFLWGIPYLLMKVAVADIPPPLIVAGRTLIGAAILIPIAIHKKSFMDAVRGIKYVLPYAFLEMVGPWILITNAEKEISSGLAGLLVATVPIFATIFTSMRGDHSVWQPKRIFGLIVGFIGIIALVGIESITGTSNPKAIAMVILSAILYAYAVLMVTSNLPGVDGVAINGLAMGITFLFYLPIAIATWPSNPVSTKAIAALVALGIFSTAIAFMLFFIVIVEIGPARGSLTTYVNTAVAVVLGIIILNEPITLGIIVGLPLVVLGSYLASRKAQLVVIAEA
ncbi:MAG: DMT family transporter [Streptomycetaceae bacterium]|jgi:drug/metabolite transporter (DMT)-like permease|nr:MAG: DMT family transporter [Streptomycetaceae bacterium]